MTERELIEGCLKGSEKAQRKLYQMYAGKLFAVCIRFAGNRKDAEDVLQDGFVKIFRSIQSFDAKGYAGIFPWMRRIMVNSLLNFLRDNRRFRIMEPLGPFSDQEEENDSDDFFTEVHSHISQEEIFEMIRDLPDGYRTVFNLYAFEDFSHAEIAKMLGISESTSKTQLRKARKKLAEQILSKMRPELQKIS